MTPTVGTFGLVALTVQDPQSHLPRAPRRGEETMAFAAGAVGRSVGSRYPWIWDAPAVIIPALLNDIVPEISRVGGQIPTRTGYLVAVWTAFAALAGSIAALWLWLAPIPIEARSEYIGLLLVPATLVIIFGLVYFGGRRILRHLQKSKSEQLDWLMSVAALWALHTVEERKVAARATSSPDGAATPCPAPAPQSFGVSGAGAVALAVAWLAHLGATGARPVDPALGYDLETDGLVGRVHNAPEVIEVPAVRELAGAAALTGRLAAFFAAQGFTEDACAFADQVDMALVVFDAVAGTISGANKAGMNLVASPPAPPKEDAE